MTTERPLRNIAIIAHVDHGKTTLVDAMFAQSGRFRGGQHVAERVLDTQRSSASAGSRSSPRTARSTRRHRFNIVDTPGHADFGGEVERVLSMVDGVLLLVDAAEGPMPQTRFVLARRSPRPERRSSSSTRSTARTRGRTESSTRSSTSSSEARRDDEQLDFPVVYATGATGYASLTRASPWRHATVARNRSSRRSPRTFRTPAADGPLQMQISALDYNELRGPLGIGRISRGSLKRRRSQAKVAHTATAADARLRLGQVLGVRRPRTQAGRSGGGRRHRARHRDRRPAHRHTLADVQAPEALPPIAVDEPTPRCISRSTLAARGHATASTSPAATCASGSTEELLTNVALRVEDTDDTDVFAVYGRGELHLTILIENMRREGYRAGRVAPPVVFRDLDGERCEPFEQLTVDVEDAHQGAVMEALGHAPRRAHEHGIRRAAAARASTIAFPRAA